MVSFFVREPRFSALSDVHLTVHRSTSEIGGNCIEIAASEGGRLILDVGRPLDAPNDAVGLLAPSLDLARPVYGLLISHAHQDHYGLLNEAPKGWPVFCGEPTERLVRLTSAIAGKEIDRPLQTWKSGVPLSVGPFRVTPHLTDHSAFDAYMLLIEVDGKRLLYSGDFRVHGRKSVLVERLMASPPPDIDVLIMEGTNLGSDKPWVTEDDLETEFVKLFNETRGRVFVAWSAQNIDRTVTLYRACKEAGRTLVIDLYTAEVLDLLKEFGRLPQPGFPNLKVVVTRAFSRLNRRKGNEAFTERMAKHGIAAKRLAQSPNRWVAMVRPSLIRDYEAAGVVPNAEDAWCWSMWRGYLSADNGAKVHGWFSAGQSRAEHIHTSGHASPADLRAFAKSINPRCMVPIHGAAWDQEVEGFPPIQRLRDGEVFAL
jgi:ribonuclease J